MSASNRQKITVTIRQCNWLLAFAGAAAIGCAEPTGVEDAFGTFGSITRATYQPVPALPAVDGADSPLMIGEPFGDKSGRTCEPTGLVLLDDWPLDLLDDQNRMRDARTCRHVDVAYRFGRMPRRDDGVCTDLTGLQPVVEIDRLYAGDDNDKPALLDQDGFPGYALDRAIDPRLLELPDSEFRVHPAHMAEFVIFYYVPENWSEVDPMDVIGNGDGGWIAKKEIYFKDFYDVDSLQYRPSELQIRRIATIQQFMNCGDPAPADELLLQNFEISDLPGFGAGAGSALVQASDYETGAKQHNPDAGDCRVVADTSGLSALQVGPSGSGAIYEHMFTNPGSEDVAPAPHIKHSSNTDVAINGIAELPTYADGSSRGFRVLGSVRDNDEPHATWLRIDVSPYNRYVSASAETGGLGLPELQFGSEDEVLNELWVQPHGLWMSGNCGELRSDCDNPSPENCPRSQAL